MNVAVVGSGLAGWACAKGLIERGSKVDVLDVGEELDLDRKTLVARLQSQDLDQWSEDDIARIKESPQFEAPGIPKRRLFGSDYVFAGERDHSPLTVEGTSFAPTFAKGGYSTLWGAAMLPFSEHDFERWPFRRATLEPYYRKVIREVPFSAAPSGLDDAFPLYTEEMDPLPLPTQCEHLLARMQRQSAGLEGLGVRFGRSRLAVRSTTNASGRGCLSCGLCLYGCVPQAIYSTAEQMDRLHAQGALRYLPGNIVRGLEEAPEGVKVTCSHPDGATEHRNYDAVFLALGTINTTRLLMRTLQLYERTVRILDSQKFILPFLTAWSTPMAVHERRPTLPALFCEIRAPDLSEHWIHAQFYALNSPIMARLGLADPARNRLRRWALAPLLHRLMVAWVSLHSDQSGWLTASLHQQSGNLHLRATTAPGTRRRIARVSAKLTRIGLKFGVLFPPIGAEIGQPGSGHHVGASFPMRRTPRDVVETDMWGRPASLQRVFAVDATIFPCVPATTIGLTAMANAWRIGAEAPIQS